MLSCFC